MSEPNNIDDLLSSLPDDEARSSRHLLGLIDRMEAGAVAGREVPSDDAAWLSLSRRIRSRDREPARRSRRGRVLALTSVSLAAACVALAVWILQPQVYVAAAGEQLEVVLPDGSRAQLNSGSSVTLSRAFSLSNVLLESLLSSERSVMLCGEAFFDVKHDRDRTFVVVTDNAELVVLGTSFNVRSRTFSGDEQTLVTLIDGSLRVSSRVSSDSPMILKPGETGFVQSGAPPRLRTDIDVTHAVSWRDGGFSYSSEPIDRIAAEVVRRFRVRVEIGEHVDTSRLMTLHYADSVAASTIIHDLCLGAGLQYRVISGGFEIIPAPER